MPGKLLPLLIALAGLCAGAGAGFALRPAPASHAPEDAACPCDCAALTGAGHLTATAEAHGEEGAPATDFVKLNNQFVLPVVKGEHIAALVVMSISLEVPAGGSDRIYQREPKLRDRFLQVLWGHANAGGFDGVFTAGSKMTTLRTALLETARNELGNNVLDIVITDIARQDM
ncbi:MAG: flagellar basal body-associated protein FliL [Rhodobacterales bacterium]|nr:MAG: flagellar basal body-associated protein FliL [Rhodobacterales bacterium]